MTRDAENEPAAGRGVDGDKALDRTTAHAEGPTTEAVESVDAEVVQSRDGQAVEDDDADADVVDTSLVDAGPRAAGDGRANAGPPAADGDGSEALAESEPATDEELDAIARAVVPAAPVGSTALALRDPLAAYMSEARKYPLLTREEERELAIRWVESGDAAAGRRLVTSNLRLVVKIANEYRRGYHGLLDLVQEGNLGLLKAVQKFDPYREVKLSTYSGWWIRAYILKFILNNWRLVKIGTTQNQRKLFYNLRKQSDALKAAGVDPSPEALARALDVSPEEVVEMQKRMAAPDSSLNAPVRGDEEGSRTRMDLLEDDDDGPAGHVESDQFKRMLAERLQRFGSTLDGRELEIFRDRLVADEPVTLQELGDRWSVSRERARQLEKRMILRLREFLQEELGDAVQIALGHD